MISKKMNPLVQNNSVIRVMFEEGKRLAAIYGAENVYDFSLGNPNVPAPQEVEDSIIETLNKGGILFLQSLDDGGRRLHHRDFEGRGFHLCSRIYE